jgi:hypothetical protein
MPHASPFDPELLYVGAALRDIGPNRDISPLAASIRGRANAAREGNEVFT